MSRKPETGFIAGVHAHLPAAVHREKMANPYRGGTADMYYDGPRSDMWIEYKFIIIPKRADTVIDIPGMLSALQTEWLRARHNNGRCISVVIGARDGGVILTDLNWEKPTTVAGFRKDIKTRKQIAEWITAKVL